MKVVEVLKEKPFYLYKVEDDNHIIYITMVGKNYMFHGGITAVAKVGI